MRDGAQGECSDPAYSPRREASARAVRDPAVRPPEEQVSEGSFPTLCEAHTLGAARSEVQLQARRDSAHANSARAQVHIREQRHWTPPSRACWSNRRQRRYRARALHGRFVTAATQTAHSKARRAAAEGPEAGARACRSRMRGGGRVVGDPQTWLGCAVD